MAMDLFFIKRTTMKTVSLEAILLNHVSNVPILQKNILRNTRVYIKNCLIINKKMSCHLLLVFLLCGLVSLLEPICLNIFIGHIDFFNSTQEWKIPLVLGIMSLLLGTILEFARQYYTIFIAGKMAFNISKMILHDFFSQSLDSLSRHAANDCYTRMYAIEQVFYRWIQQLCYLGSDGLFLLMQIMMMFIFSWPLALMDLIFMLLMGLTHQFGLQRYFKQSQEITAQQQQHLTFFLEILRHLSTIKIFQKELVVWNLWQLRVMPYWQAFLKNDFFQGQVLLSMSSLRKLNSLLVGLGGLFLVAQHDLRLGLFVGFLVLKIQANATFEAIFKRLMQWQYLKTPLIRLEDLIGCSENEKNRRLAMNIQLRKVEYVFNRYFSKEFISGKKYLIKGASGCGKTTLLKCITGIEKPLGGQVSACVKFGVVLQNDALLPGTIFENISFYSDEVDKELFKKVCEVVALNLDSDLSVAYLSQGEQQRVLIARALYSKPQWLILDEATCHLDAIGEEQLIRNLIQLPLGILMVSHQVDVKLGFDECLELS